jgi:PAS domain S-box-containing protein
VTKKRKALAPDLSELRRRAETEQTRNPASSGAAFEGKAVEGETARLVHELQVHQIELQMQNEELHRVQAEDEAHIFQYTDLYDFAPVGYLSLSRDGTILKLNLTAASLFGAERSQLASRRLGAFLSAGFRPALVALLDKVFERRVNASCEAALLKQGGGAFWVHIEATASTDGTECRAVIMDITDRVRADEQLHAAKSEVDRLLEASDKSRRALLSVVEDQKLAQDALRIEKERVQEYLNIAEVFFLVIDLSGNVVLVNRKGLCILGRPESEVVGKNWCDSFLPERSRDKVRRVFAEVFAGNVEEHRQGEDPVVRGDGTERLMAWHGTVIRDGVGNITGILACGEDITDQRRSERERMLMTHTLSASLNEIYLFDADTLRFRYVNEGARNNLGYTLMELQQMTPLDIKPEFTAGAFEQLVEPLRNREIPVLVFETVHLRADGTLYPVEVHLQCFTFDDDRVFLAVVQDITERRRAEQERTLLADTISASLNEIFIMDGETLRFRYANQGALRNLGYTLEELQEMTLAGIAPEFDDESLNRLFEPLRTREEKEKVFETLHRRKDESTYPVEVHLQGFDREGDRVYLAVVQDVTERRLAERELQRAAAHWQSTFNSVEDCVCMFDAENHIVQANRAFLRTFDTRMDAVRGRPCWEVIHGAGQPVQDCPVLRTKGSLKHEEVVLFENDKWFEVLVDPVLDDAGRLSGFVHTMRDITRRKRSEEELKKSEARFRELYEKSPVSYQSLDADARILDVNPAWVELFGYAREDVIGRWVGDFLVPAQRLVLSERFLVFKAAGRIHNAEFTFLCRDGRPVIVSVDGLIARDETGAFVRTHCVLHDVTDRYRREREHAAVVEVSRALRTARSSGEMCPLVLTHSRSLLNADGGLIALRHEAGNEIVVESAIGHWGAAQGRCLPAGQGVIGTVFETGQTFVSDGICEEPGGFLPYSSGDSGCAACLPLIANEQVIGVLYLMRAVAFKPDEVAIVAAVADIAANAIHRARLFGQIERRVRQLDTLRTVDRAIAGSFDLQLTLGVLLEQTTAQLNVDAAAIHLQNPRTRTVECAAARGFRTELIRTQQPRTGEGVLGMILLERKPVLAPDLQSLEAQWLRKDLVASERFVAYAGFPLIVKGSVRGVIEVFSRRNCSMDEEWAGFAEALAGLGALAIENTVLVDEMQRANVDLRIACDATIESWARAVDLACHRPEGHCERVSDLATELAHAMGVRHGDLANFRRGALLHDIGMTSVPDSILLKPGSLTDEEWEVIRRHPVHAFEMLLPVKFLKQAIDIPYCHHERWDGSGYPRGLAGSRIPLAARIFGVVAVWDALISDRPWRKAWDPEQALEHIRGGAGSLFDPEVVDVFVRLVEESPELWLSR